MPSSTEQLNYDYYCPVELTSFLFSFTKRMTNDKLVERHLSIKVQELNVFNPARRLHFFQLSWREVTLFESDNSNNYWGRVRMIGCGTVVGMHKPMEKTSSWIGRLWQRYVCAYGHNHSQSFGYKSEILYLVSFVSPVFL